MAHRTRNAPPAGHIFTLAPLLKGPASLAINPTVTLVWHHIADKLPDAEIEVLLAIETQNDAQQGYLCDILEDGRLVFAYVNSGMPIRGKVYAWAELPAAPAPKEFAKGGA